MSDSVGRTFCPPRVLRRNNLPIAISRGRVNTVSDVRPLVTRYLVCFTGDVSFARACYEIYDISDPGFHSMFYWITSDKKGSKLTCEIKCGVQSMALVSPVAHEFRHAFVI